MEETIKAVLSSVLEMNSSKIDENTSLESVETWDSLRHINLIIALEEEFGIQFTEEEIVNMLSYRLIHLTIRDKLNEK